MRTACWSVTLIVLTAFSAGAQQRPFVMAVGDATVTATPDEAKIQFSVVTQAQTAQDAANQNANQVNAVLAALRSLLGATASLQTLSYSLNPNYSNGNQPVIVGYTANNTVQATLSDLSVIGKAIDTGIQAGANRVQGLVFDLKDDQPIRAQALKLATAQAKVNADAMASGLGLKTGSAISIQQGTNVNIQPVLGVAAPTAATPIETGVTTVRATVTLQIALVE
jgi:uncharacterized protein YggE